MLALNDPPAGPTFHPWRSSQAVGDDEIFISRRGQAGLSSTSHLMVDDVLSTRYTMW